MVEIITNNARGQAFVADRVISSVVYASAMEVDGITGVLGQSRNLAGIKTEITGRDITIEFNVSARFGTKIQKMTELVQERVKMAVETMTGLNVVTVNVGVMAIAAPKFKAVKTAKSAGKPKNLKKPIICPICGKKKCSGIKQ